MLIHLRSSDTLLNAYFYIMYPVREPEFFFSDANSEPSIILVRADKNVLMSKPHLFTRITPLLTPLLHTIIHLL